VNDETETLRRIVKIDAEQLLRHDPHCGIADMARRLVRKVVERPQRWGLKVMPQAQPWSHHSGLLAQPGIAIVRIDGDVLCSASNAALSSAIVLVGLGPERCLAERTHLRQSGIKGRDQTLQVLSNIKSGGSLKELIHSVTSTDSRDFWETYCPGSLLRRPVNLWDCARYENHHESSRLTNVVATSGRTGVEADLPISHTTSRIPFVGKPVAFPIASAYSATWATYWLRTRYRF
jgi:hypothetical protein